MPVDGQILGQWEIGPGEPAGRRHLRVLVEDRVPPTSSTKSSSGGVESWADAMSARKNVVPLVMLSAGQRQARRHPMLLGLFDARFSLAVFSGCFLASLLASLALPMMRLLDKSVTADAYPI